jgi:protocatechuate 3,4-dioxygenase alpha subunit
VSLLTTPSQTIGPYLRIGLEALSTETMVSAEHAGERVSITGIVYDGDQVPVNDCAVEVWQADAQGRYAGSDAAPGPGAFRGFGRALTGADGGFRIHTIKPGRVQTGTAWRAPHLAITLFMRGSLRHLLTRMYFPDDPANADDPVLSRVPAARRHTLIAQRRDGGLEWSIRMQGPDETVFFDF